MVSFKGKIALVTLSGTIAVYAFLGSFLSTFAQQPINDAGAQMRIFGSVLQHIQNDYVDEPDWNKVRAGALRGLPYGLDPYSSYLTEDQVRDFRSNKAATQAGIGAEFSQVSSYLYVISVIKGSPAEKAGLLSGDVIEYIENKATRDISLYDARELLRGETGSAVKLRVLRSGAKPQTISVTRAAFTAPFAEARMENAKTAVLKVHSLESGHAVKARERLSEVIRGGAEKIVLDLRGVSAGTLDEAVAVANLFIKEGSLAQVIGREGKVLESRSAKADSFVFGGPLAVLIDGSSAGPAEVVAAAVLESKRGEVVGEKSFGAGTEQELFQMKRGDGLLLTVRKWASAAGKPFLGTDRASTGVKPSVEVKGADGGVDVESLIGDDEDSEPAPSPAASPSPDSKSVSKPGEDLKLKKALEILSR